MSLFLTNNPRLISKKAEPLTLGWGSILLLLSISLGVITALVDNPIPILGISSILLILVFLVWRWPHLVIIIFLISSRVKAIPQLSALSYFWTDTWWLDPTVVLALILYLILIGRFFTKFNVTSTALRKQLWPLLLFGAFIFILLISTGYENSTDYGFDKVLRFVSLSALSFIVPMLLLRSEKDLEIFMMALIIASITLVLLSRPDKLGRFTVAGGENPISLARYSGTALILIIWWKIPSSSSQWLRLFWITLTIALTAILIGTGARGPLIAAVFVSCFLILLVLFRMGLKQTIIYLLILLFGLILTVWLGKDLLPTETKMRIAGFTTPVETIKSNPRFEMFHIALDNFASNPLSGSGAGTFELAKSTNSRGEIRKYPHNIMLEVGAEQGILGLLFLILLLGATSYVAFRNLNRRVIQKSEVWLAVTLLGLFLFHFLNSLVSGDLNDNRLLLLSMGMIWWSGIFIFRKSRSSAIVRRSENDL